ncbi:MAG: hypothetical protein IJE14_06105 [Clostridia bacterium]|nr:hypothetical protein [Clostridia bacterium]
MKKIKGSLSKPEPFAIIAAAAISLCALLPLRVYQVARLIDPQTGFFTESSFTVPLFYILCAAVVAGVAAVSFLSEKAGRTRNIAGRSIPTGVASGLTALAVMFDSVYRVSSFIEINASYIEASDLTRIQYLSKSGATALLLQAVFGVLTAFFLWIYTVSCLSKSARLNGFAILSVAPVAWAICRIIVRFVRKISFVNVSDLLLELFMLVFLITFFMAFAQIVTKVTPEDAAWRLYGCGVPAALLAFLVSVPRLFLIIIGHSDSLVADYGFNICDLAMSVFIPLFLYNTACAKKQTDK